MKPTTKAWFTQQVICHQTSLFRTARAILSSDEDAEDAVQEAILSAYTRLDTLRDPEKFKPWLLRILVNQCYTLRRQEKPTVDLTEVADILPAETRDTAESLTLRQAVEQLPTDQQVILSLYYGENASYEALSRLLKLPEGTVKSRLNRAKAHLRQILGQENAAF